MSFLCYSFFLDVYLPIFLTSWHFCDTSLQCFCNCQCLEVLQHDNLTLLRYPLAFAFFVLKFNRFFTVNHSHNKIDFCRAESKKDEHLTVSSKEKKKRSETAKTGRRSSPKRSRRESSDGAKSPPPPVTPASEIDQSSIAGESVQEFKQLKLTHFRLSC